MCIYKKEYEVKMTFMSLCAMEIFCCCCCCKKMVIAKCPNTFFFVSSFLFLINFLLDNCLISDVIFVLEDMLSYIEVYYVLQDILQKFVQ